MKNGKKVRKKKRQEEKVSILIAFLIGAVGCKLFANQDQVNRSAKVNSKTQLRSEYETTNQTNKEQKRKKRTNEKKGKRSLPDARKRRRAWRAQSQSRIQLVASHCTDVFCHHS
jgi:hypothetical protein